jgi:uncharacterized Fe-S cluster-containing protein
VIIEVITDMIENVLLNVKQQLQNVETTLKKNEKIVMTEDRIEQRIVKIIVQRNVQQIFEQKLHVETVQ